MDDRVGSWRERGVRDNDCVAFRWPEFSFSRAQQAFANRHGFFPLGLQQTPGVRDGALCVAGLDIDGQLVLQEVPVAREVPGAAEWIGFLAGHPVNADPPQVTLPAGGAGTADPRVPFPFREPRGRA